MIKGFIYKHDESNNFDYLADPFKEFQENFNDILKPTYKSIADETKRATWFSKDLKFRFNFDKFQELLFILIKSNFKNSNLINPENINYLKYLIEKKTGKVYKIESFGLDSYYYTSIIQDAIVVIKVSLTKRKKCVLLNYKECYFTKRIMRYTTFTDTMQKIETKKQFNTNLFFIKNKIDQILKDQ